MFDHDLRHRATDSRNAHRVQTAKVRNFSTRFGVITYNKDQAAKLQQIVHSFDFTFEYYLPNQSLLEPSY
jgi:hypothetical protein